MNLYSRENIIPLAQKYLDRVKTKGLQEHHEFSTLISFFAAIEKGEVLLSNVKELSPGEPQ